MARYEFDKKGFTAMVNGPGATRFANHLAEHWAARLRELSPYSETGGDDAVHYRDNIVHWTGQTTLPKLEAQYPRVAAFIGNTVPYATALEFATKPWRTAPRPLHRLIDEVQAADPNFGRRKTKGGA